MKSFFIRRSGQIAGLLLFASPWALRAADARADLEGFRKKIAAEEAKPSPDFPMRGSQLSMQIKLLENLMARGDDDRALQALETLGNYGVPPQFQEEWLRISAVVSAELEKGKAGRLEKWAAAVDQLVKDTKKACLEAKSSDDLDALLLRCSTVQMQGERNSTVMGERLNHKLQGVTQTLSAWTSYLDYQNAGDKKKANDVLRGLMTNSSHYPVLTVKEMESRLADAADTEVDGHTAVAKILASVNSPEDLPTALERLQSYIHNPLNQQANSWGNEAAHITAYIDAWKSAQAGDATNAVAMLGRSFSGFEDIQRYYAPIKIQIEARMVKDKARGWTKLPMNPDENPRSYLGRILDELKERGDYATMLDVMSFASQFDRTAATLSSSTDRQAIEQFLAGQRFEKAGDGLAAVTSYRIVIGLSGGKYVPADKAQDALKELQGKYPEAFKSYEGVLLEQLRGLSLQLQMLQQNRPMGMPHRPY